MMTNRHRGQISIPDIGEGYHLRLTMADQAALSDREAMGEGWAVLMQNHGLLVAGRTLRRAADMAEIIERTSEVILGCYAVGQEPPVLPDDVVETLSQYGDLMA